MVRDKIETRGEVHLVLRGPDGRVKDERRFRNLIVTSGKNLLAAILGASGTKPSHLAVGTGTTAPAAGQTALVSEIGTRVSLTHSNPSSNVWRMVGTFGPGNATGAITEAGLFNASSGGTMFARQTFAVINKDENDSLEITWEITFV